jgi:hypothetical protein
VNVGALIVGVGDSARGITFSEWLERWHEFYLMAGTAAVTLAGLLFVALSLHLDRFVEVSHEHLLALARVTLLSYTFVLFASLFMLVPPTGRHQTAVMLGATCMILGNAAGTSWELLVQIAKQRRSMHQG